MRLVRGEGGGGGGGGGGEEVVQGRDFTSVVGSLHISLH